MRLLLSVWICGLVTTVCAAHVHAADAPQATLRIYNAIAIGHADLDSARAAVQDIFQRAHVSVAWTDCGAPGEPMASECQQPLGAAELAVRIVRTPPADDARTVFGVSHIDTSTRLGTLATVFWDTVSVAAAHSGLHPGTLLGRTIAHEAGHLLLGSTAHTETGLMRAVWSDALLARHRGPDQWRFTRSEATSIRGELFARTSDGSSEQAMRTAGIPMLRPLP